MPYGCIRIQEKEQYDRGYDKCHDECGGHKPYMSVKIKEKRNVIQTLFLGCRYYRGRFAIKPS